MARTYENHTTALQVRIENLEEEKRRLVKEVQTAHQLNEEIQRRLEGAQDSSTSVAKKNYDHALRVIRDLIKDRSLAAEGVSIHSTLDIMILNFPRTRNSTRPSSMTSPH